MYVHLGNDVLISDNEIIAILDLEKSTVTAKGKKFLNMQNNVITVSYDMPKSVVVCKDKIYISHIAPATLKLRASRKD
ncbi:MAG: DUF370 domain-containing protein [Oscillospiraceae bacterium]